MDTGVKVNLWACNYSCPLQHVIVQPQLFLSFSNYDKRMLLKVFHFQYPV